MNKALRGITLLPGIMFLLIGLQWVFVPADAAAQLGMPFLDVASRGSQIADEAGFFIACGIIIILGVVTLQRQWLYAAAMLVGVAGVARILATLLHDAAMVTSSLAIEVIVPAILLTAAIRICR
jgi:hypothetical protein